MSNEFDALMADLDDSFTQIEIRYGTLPRREAPALKLVSDEDEADDRSEIDPVTEGARLAGTRMLNDLFRQGSDVPGVQNFSPEFSALADQIKSDVMELIAAYDDFDGDDLHDFGGVDHAESGRVLWSIEVYADERCEAPSEQPGHKDESFRVLTVMLASETQ